MVDQPPLFAGVEAGGTKFVLGIGDGAGRILARHQIATTTPEATLNAALDWFITQPPVAALGIASFGPLILDPQAADYGCIGQTPKPGWSGAPILPQLAAAMGIAAGIDTDVNGAALAEATLGAAVGADVAIYVTVGTGIGGGLVIDGRPVHGNSHPEMGHMRIGRHPDDAGFAGVCPFHGDCLEGLASGPAIIARFGDSLDRLAAGHPAHAMVADDLARACVNWQAVLAPQRIVMGGGVMQAPGMIGRVRAAAARHGADYFPVDWEALIVPPALGQDAGLTGALLIAASAKERSAG